MGISLNLVDLKGIDCDATRSSLKINLTLKNRKICNDFIATKLLFAVFCTF